jgi:hypothetical protein
MMESYGTVPGVTKAVDNMQKDVRLLFSLLPLHLIPQFPHVKQRDRNLLRTEVFVGEEGSCHTIH